MSNRNLINIGLFVFILILVTLVVYEPGKEVAATPPILTNLKASDVYHIKIDRHNASGSEKLIEIEKTSNGWMMVQPYSVSANTFRIDSILKLLAAVSFSKNDLSELKLSTFGLDKPKTTITFNKKIAIIFGHNKSLRYHRYIQIDSTLHMIADTFFYKLAAKTESYISHKLLPNNNKIEKILLPDMQLENTDGNWSITPKSQNISADAINQFISEWELSQAYDINKVKVKSNQETDITIHLKNKVKIHFNIEENKDSFNLINLDTGVRYILSSDRKDKLLTISNIHQDE